LPGLQLPEAFASPSLPRTGQVSEQQFPPQLTRAVETFRSSMSQIAHELHQKRLDAGAAQQQVSAACDAVVQALNDATRDDELVEVGMDDLLMFRDVANLARGIGGYVFRETFSWFMQSSTIARGYEKLHGHAEDREFLERLERNEPEGDGRLGPLIDAWFLNRPLCRGRRDSVTRMTALLRQALAEIPKNGPARVASLAAGTAQEIFALLNQMPRPVYVTSIAHDAEALLANTARATELGCDKQITFLQAELTKLISGKSAISLGKQHVIYALSACDYLNDEQLGQLLKWSHSVLEAGGGLVVTHRDAASPDWAFTKHILDWPVVHRSAEDVGRIMDASPFGAGPQIVQTEGYLLVERRR
jgi:hypothetical protein